MWPYICAKTIIYKAVPLHRFANQADLLSASSASPVPSSYIFVEMDFWLVSGRGKEEILSQSNHLSISLLHIRYTLTA